MKSMNPGDMHHMSRGAHSRAMGGEYHNEEAKPHQPKQGHEAGMMDAKVSDHFKGEMMGISYGKFGKAGYDMDAKRIAPYMEYNDNADQNGY